MKDCLRVTKEIMREWEKRNKEDEEMSEEFGRKESENVRILHIGEGDRVYVGIHYAQVNRYEAGFTNDLREILAYGELLKHEIYLIL